MKKLLFSALIAGCVLLSAGIANAQTKIGHINFQALVTGDPSFKGIQTQIETYTKTFADQQKGYQDELQTKGAEYDAKRATMTDAVRLKAESDLQDLNKRLTDFNQTAQNLITQKSNELYKPLVDKMKAAIAQVAKEKGYAYVIDSSQVELLVSPEADDLTASVKAKVGGGAAPAATAPAKK